MKKTLAVAAVLAAFAGTAAADVSIYGRMDYGMQYKHTDGNTVDAVDDWGVEAGGYTTSRLGFKVVEQLGDAKVGVTLETGMNAGKAFSSGFDREARVYAQTAYGTFSVGRMGILNSDANYSGIMMGIQNVQGSGSFSGGEGVGMFVKPASRMDKVLTYASPVMAGTQLWAQYAGGDNTSGEDRYYALGATYKAGAFQAGVVVDYLNKNSMKMAGAKAAGYKLTESGKKYVEALGKLTENTNEGVADAYKEISNAKAMYTNLFNNMSDLEKFHLSSAHYSNKLLDHFNGAGMDVGAARFDKEGIFAFEGATDAERVSADDQMTVNFGANYDFGVAKVYGGAQYFKNAADFGTDTLANAGLADVQDLEGFGLTVSAAFPGVLGGTVKASATYMEGESDAAKVDAKAFDVAVQYAYNFSKNTLVYAGVGYMEEEVEEYDSKTVKASVGVAHYF